MRYIPTSDQDTEKMLETLDLTDIDELFSKIPKKHLLNKPLDLPSPLSELEITQHLTQLSKKNASTDSLLSLLGGGAYNHWIPSVVDHLASRSEFSTAYTPYQPEVSQGTLQAIFEFQSMIAEITGMEISNASLYDGATATMEAALMSLRVLSKKKKGRMALISRSLHPDYKKVCKTYFEPIDIQTQELPYSKSGSLDLNKLERLLETESNEIFCVMIQSPNYFGVVEDITSVSKLSHKYGSHLIVSVPESISLGLLPSPGKCGADIVAGEAQSLGNPLSFGGPYVGYLSAHLAEVRQIPGRLIGATTDVHGKRAFTLTLATREQHIRRERATSNICTNQGLCALRTTIYLALLGKQGFHEVAYQNYAKSDYAKRQITQIKGVSLPFSGPTFNEWVLQLPIDSNAYLSAMKEQGILAGIPLLESYEEQQDCILVCFTEITTKDQIDHWVQTSSEIIGSLQ